MKAMLLAAGRGERLRPLTDHVPKALVQVGGKPLIAWHLERLAASGCREAVINVAYLAQKIVDTIGDGASFGLRISFSREAEPLETAGGIAQALPLLGEEPFLLVNADIYCDIGFRRLLELPLDARLAHLVLVPNPPHRAQGDFSLEAGNVGNDGAPRYTYAGIAVLSPRLVESVKRGDKAPLAPLLRSGAQKRLISGELFGGLWQDVGTAERLAELETQLAPGHTTRHESK
ncbi:MAG TPA: nucleotidyltransferase family protein [Burkholderiales bacterium]|nr:nucleotidyltransferase family protein [Burkholderiales bacterium]